MKGVEMSIGIAQETIEFDDPIGPGEIPEEFKKEDA